MANEWDLITTTDADTDVDFVLFNKYGNCIKTWGYGKTPGSQTVDANQNTLSNLGSLRTTDVKIGGQPPLADVPLEVAAAEPLIVIKRTAGGTNAKYWDINCQGDFLSIRTINDAFSSAVEAIKISRSSTSTALTGISITPDLTVLGGHVGVGVTPGVALHVRSTTGNFMGGIRLDTSGANEAYDLYRDSGSGYLQFLAYQSSFSGYNFFVKDPGGTLRLPLSIGNDRVIVVEGAWNGGHIKMATSHLWVDALGRLRIHGAAPTSDTDGTVVGSQS